MGNPIERPDAIIVGSGAGGGTAARALTDAGWSVIVMEKGEIGSAEDYLPYDELHFLEHKALIPHKQDAQGNGHDHNVHVDSTGKASRSERWWIANMVGGSTNLWEANLPRYTDEDFAVLNYFPDPPSDTSMVNWPWTYESFQPYFEKAEHEWCVSGRAGQSPVQEPMRPGYDYPMPPLRAHGQVPFITSMFNRVGMNPYRSPRGINSRTFDSRPGCPFCGYCQGFGCAVNDRASAQNTVLPRALATGRCEIRTSHCVTRIVHEKGKVLGVAYKTEPNGKEKVLKAPRVIVSIQAIESARLFLLSDMPNKNGLIGRYLTYHTKGSAEFVFPGQPVWGTMDPDDPYQPRTSLGSLQLRDLYVINDPQTHLTKGGKFSIYDPYTINPPIKALTRTGLRPTKARRLWGQNLLDRMMELRSKGGMSLSFTGETMSLYDNRVELDATDKDPWGMPVAKTHYRHHDYDLALSKYALDRICDIVGNAGGQVRALSPQGIENPGYGHNHGTLRAGADPGESVLDENCQSHEVEGLYVLDSAFMPTAGASNPTLTQIANAFRVCENMPRA